MKYNYFVLNNGIEKQVKKKEFIYFVKEFAVKTFNFLGYITFKSNYSDIWSAYNPQGVLIAWKR